MFGPLYVLTHRLSPPGPPGGIAIQRWYLADGTHHLRLLVHCSPAELHHTTDPTRAFLRTRGIEPDPTRQTVVRSALVALAAGAPGATRAGGRLR